ncbi:condensation domain-containing protein [Williamsia herbipolensis]|uniref:condensation domain-containing protein n=1 Tax=Williamsia herbipolensis TaxID=1603258 RepID=UPI000A51D7BA|nr:condensation domain-containing protein [Williamsia herbipolensis]
MIDMLAHWNPGRGTVMEVLATEESRAAAAAAQAHPAPASFLQENHLRGTRAASDRGDRHCAYLTATTEVDGDFDAAALVGALRRFTTRHDGLRCWFDVSDGVVTRHLVDADDVDFRVERVGEVDDYGYLTGAVDSNRFRDHVTARFAREANALHWPGFSVGVVVRPHDFTVYIGCDHALSDGVSQALALAEVADLYYSERDGTDVGPFTDAPTGSALAYAVAERERAARFTPESPEVQAWCSAAAPTGGGMPRFPIDLGLADGESAPVKPVKFDVLDAAGAAEFEEICRAHGARMIGGITAVLAIVDRELAGVDDYFTITALADRALADVTLTQGWFCRFAPVAFGVDTARTFTDLVGTAQSACERGAACSEVPVPTVIGALLAAGTAPERVLVTPQLLSYIDFRRFPMAGTPAYDRGMQSTGEGRTANASMWFNRDDRSLYLGSQIPDTPRAATVLAAHHRRIREIFADIVSTGDHVIGAVGDAGVKRSSLARHHD